MVFVWSLVPPVVLLVVLLQVKPLVQLRVYLQVKVQRDWDQLEEAMEFVMRC